MRMKSVFFALFFLILFPILSYAQSDFIRHKTRYLSLEQKPQSIGRDTLMIIELDSLMQCINYTDRKEVQKFNELYILGLLRKHSQNNDWLKGKAIYNLWNAVHGFYNTGQHIKTFQSYALAESQFEKLSDYDHQALTLIRMGLGLTYTYKGVKNELKYFDKAYLLAVKAKNIRLMFNSLNAKGIYYNMKNDLTNALKIYREYDRLNDPKLVNNLGNKLNIGYNLLQLDSLEKALAYIKPTLKLLPNKSVHDKYMHYNVYEELITYYLKKRNFIEAEKFLPKLKEFCYEESLINKYPKFEYEVHKGLGNNKVALEALEKYQQFLINEHQKIEKNNIEGMKSQVVLHEQTAKFQKAELDKLRSENAKQNQFRWFLAALSIIGLLSTIYVLYTNKRLRNVNQSLINKNAEISAALLQGQTLERKRVAADLHDNLGSTMSSLIWTMDAIDANKLAPEEKDVYQNLKKMLSNAYDEVRLLSHNLLPEEFEKQGLTAALQYFVRKVNQNSSIKFNLLIDDTFEKLDKKVEFELYSICLELINNIIKHSKATEAKIELSRTENQVKLLISDNGIGTFKNESDGKGMKNVKARVDSLNGTWEILTPQNQGFINKITVNV